ESDVVLDNINIEIAKGEFGVLVGPSGCGKSTLLRIIAGLESITKGDIKLNNKVINKKEPKDRDIAMVFQNYALYPHMTVFENMAYGLRIQKYKKNEILKRVDKAAEILELSSYLYKTPQELSGGQRQRVAMGRAIVRQPAVFLFDEPLSNLDSHLKVQMRREIKKLHRELGVTILYVTHDQVEAMTLAEKLIVINNGKVEQISSPIGIYESPASIFVGGFIGSPQMNFVKGKINNNKFRISDNILLDVDNFTNSTEEVVIGFRPENVYLNDNNSQYENSLQLKVDEIELLGSDVLIYTNIAGTEEDNKITLRMHKLLNLKHNDVVSVNIPKKHIHVFDAHSGKSI
ncbi:MAG: sn-glycerol-3-phosphate ABC transporter ATP-binding protein UgpC, partial [Legionellales bacterium]|nr:sn-glycerol-3-phosphate ABC transporter ATP-binding protein UgpC [Legionellales bacterium]